MDEMLVTLKIRARDNEIKRLRGVLREIIDYRPPQCVREWALGHRLVYENNAIREKCLAALISTHYRATLMVSDDELWRGVNAEAW